MVVLAIVSIAIGLPAGGQANFPGRSGLIAFSSLQASAGRTFKIETVRPNGRGRRGILTTSSPSQLPSGPAYSPDGRQIAFQTNGELQVMDADGSNVHAVTTGVFYDDVAFSPGGDRLLFTRQAEGNVDVYTVRTDGSELTRLTSDPGRDRQATWSPNGRLIAFVSNRSGSAHVWLMRADGSGQHLLVADRPHRDDGQVTPDFAPDGHRIAVVKGARVLTMRLDGSHQQVLSSRSTILIEPVYSPDGRQIAAIERTPRRRNEILIMNVDGSRKHTIKTHVDAHGTSGMFGIAWQPLGR